MDIWVYASIVVIILILFTVGIILYLGHALGLSIVSQNIENKQAYLLLISMKINGKPILAELDTGMPFTLIPGGYVNQLGLSGQGSRTLGQGMHMGGIGGGGSFLQATDVSMQLEGGKTFVTGVLLSPGENGPRYPLLSLEDLYHAFRLQFVPIR